MKRAAIENLRRNRTGADSRPAERRRAPRRCARILLVAGAMVWLAGLSVPALAAPAEYPTEALAEYVLGCMAANGQSPEVLRRCSCSIDYIAGKLSYEDYVDAETVLRMRQEKSGKDQFVMFKASPWAQEMVDKLRRVQVEADRKCF